jgi:hypothetical protein
MNAVQLVLELADVAGPGMAANAPARFVAQLLGGPSGGVERLERGQQEHIVPRVAQGGRTIGNTFSR